MGGGMNRDQPLDRRDQSNRHRPWRASGRHPRVFLVRTPYDTRTNGRAEKPGNRRGTVRMLLGVIVQFVGLLVLLATLLILWLVVDAALRWRP